MNLTLSPPLVDDEPNGFIITSLLATIAQEEALDRPDTPMSLQFPVATSLIMNSLGNVTSILQPDYRAL